MKFSSSGFGRKPLRVGIDGRVLQQTPAGAARYLASLLNELIVKYSEEYILYLDADRELRVALPQENLTTVFVRLPVPRIEALFECVLLPLRIQRDRLNVYVGPYYTLPIFRPCPSLVIIYDVSFLRFPYWWPRSFGQWKFKYFSRLAARKADRIVTISDFSRGEIIRTLGVRENRIQVIPGGVNSCFRPPRSVEELEQIRQQLQSRYGISKRFLLYVGTVFPRRNLDILTQAFSDIRRDYPDLNLVIVGQHPLNKKGRRKTPWVLDEGIRIFEWIPEEDLVSLYRAAEVFVYISSYEGFGLPILEAMACGTPVITSDRPPMRDLVSGIGRTVPPRDKGALVTALRGVLSQPERRDRLGAGGLQRSKEFTWRESAKKFHILIREVADVRNPAGKNG